VGRSSRFEFPHWFGSVAIALALHGGLGWLLVSQEAVEAVTREPRPVVLWLDAPAAGESAGAPADSEREAPTARASLAHRSAPAVRRSATQPPAQRKPVNTAPSASQGVALSPSPSFAGAGVEPSTGAERGDLPGAGATGGNGAGAGAARAVDAGQQQASAARGSAARLLGAGNPCADLFPYAARSDSGSVAVALDVASSGRADESYIVEETPRGQGFAMAARHCVGRLRFSPARDATGQAVASRSVVRLRFERRSDTRRAAL
jgi:hypothetical protein